MSSIFSTIDTLRDAGFQGGIPIRELQYTRCRDLPARQGVYVIVRDRPTPPSFLPISVGGFFKGKNPTVSLADLEGKWVTGTPVVYIGKAGGDTSSATLKKRLWQYMQFGQGKDIGHWGGRYIWQIEDNKDLIVMWKATDRDAESVESELLDAFIARFGRLPFANLVRGRGVAEVRQPLVSDSLHQHPIRIKMNSKADSINEFLQSELSKRNLASVTAVEAAKWLDKAGLLKDSTDRPGKPLRDLLRAGKIKGAVQGSDSRWEIGGL